MFGYGECDIYHVGGEESREVEVVGEVFIRKMERNWKRRKRRIKKVKVDCNLEGKVAFQGEEIVSGGIPRSGNKGPRPGKIPG
ncbi:unnamed protein product [Linum trigynum]|uniref:Uncharacterized protein n=1 Tax=Linum trigynum TaxID=586398 RepID=A0AAV2FLS6_9ROSI